jgi:hypothetical protein
MNPEETLTLVIETPRYYERTHILAKCPLCESPNLNLHLYMPVREFGFFDINLYNCNTICGCDCGKPHRFSAKHELLRDAGHLKIYDRTHVKGAW